MPTVGTRQEEGARWGTARTLGPRCLCRRSWQLWVGTGLHPLLHAALHGGPRPFPGPVPCKGHMEAAMGEPRQPPGHGRGHQAHVAQHPASSECAKPGSSKGNLGDGISWPERSQSWGVSRV